MALINFSSSVCNYTTSAKVIVAAPGSVATNSYEYVDLEMVPDSGYYLDAANFTYLSNDYVDYVTFMPDGNNLKARVYLKSFTWPSERTDLEVPISGCASIIIPTAPTPSPAPTPTPTPVPTPPACPAVSGYFINKSIIELRGETRIFKVYGQQGATFSYSIIDNDNGFSLDTGTETIPYAGFVNIEVVVPLNATARVFDVTITTAEACTLQLQTQPATFKLYQGIDEKWLGNTYECCEAAGVLLSNNCVGYDLYGTYTDGQCGTTNSLIETNSATCGYVPPAPPPTAPTPPSPPPVEPTTPTTPTEPTPPSPPPVEPTTPPVEPTTPPVEPTTPPVEPTTPTTPTPPACNEWELIGGPGGSGLFEYTDCNGIVQQESVESGDSGPVCASDTPALISGYGSMTFNGACGTPTTPTEPTPPPTAPTPPVPTAPSYNYYRLDECDGGPNELILRTTSTYSTNTSFEFFGGCFRIYQFTNKADWDANPGLQVEGEGTAYTDCTACEGTPPPTAPTPPVPTAPSPAAPTVWNLLTCPGGSATGQSIGINDGGYSWSTGDVTKASDGTCYEIGSSGTGAATLTGVSFFNNCAECTDSNGGI